MALENQKLKMATFDKLNDPFELCATELSDKKIRESFNTIKKKLARETGFISFCSYWSNPIMWAHYADSHNGMCLVFEISDKYVYKVTYLKERKSIEWLSLPTETKKSMGPNEIFAKSFYWKYEKEWRLSLNKQEDNFDIKSGLYFAEFDEDISLNGVILGCYSNLLKNDILNSSKMLSKDNIIKARPAFKTFKIVEDKSFV